MLAITSLSKKFLIYEPPNPGIEPRSCLLQADSLPAEPPGKPLMLINQPYILQSLRGVVQNNGPQRGPHPSAWNL